MVHGRAWRSPVLVVASLALLPAASPPAVADTGPASPAVPAHEAGWREVHDYYRGLAGNPPAAVDAGLSEAAARLARTFTATGVVSGGDQPVPSAGPPGPTAVMTATATDIRPDRAAVDLWADSLGSSVDLFSPHVLAVGFGQHTDPAAARLRTGSVGYALFPSTHQRLAAPQTMPRAGSVVSRRVYPESVDAAWAPCPALPTRSPVLLAYFPDPPSAPVANVTRDGRPMATCPLRAEALKTGLGDEGSARFGLLRNRAVAVLLGEPLVAGSHYEGEVTAGGQRATWSFSTAVEAGYWMLTDDATVFPFGAARHHGQRFTNRPALDPEPTTTGNGYWLLDALGAVSPFGDAQQWGQSPPLAAGEFAVSLSATPGAGGTGSSPRPAACSPTATPTTSGTWPAGGSTARFSAR